MFTEKAKKNADACRFCWMCRHLCPVQLATGKESNTPRAKGLLVSMFERGLPMDEGAAEIMYGCLLCNACTDNCVTGFDPPMYIRQARSKAMAEGLAPKYIETLADTLLSGGNLYGAPAPEVDFAGVPETGDVLVWLGQTARYSTPEVAQALFTVLRKAGVPFAALRDEPQSGSALYDLIGPVEEARAKAREAATAIATSGAKTLVVLDTYDAVFFLHECADFGIELPTVVTATAYVAELVAQGKLTPRREALAVTYHDPSRLARDLTEHEPARAILAAMGCELHEMFQNRQLARCCGSALMGRYWPDVREKVAQGRWSDVPRTGVTTLVSACPQSAEALSQTVPEGYQFKDLFVLLSERIA